MDRKILFALALFLILPSVMAESSSITLEIVVTDGTPEVVATNVFDDDSSIGFVDVFVTSSAGVSRTTFTNVSEGQTLNLSFNESDALAYNFNDVDGSIFGLGVNIIIQGVPQGCTQEDGCPPVFVREVLNSFALTPRIASGNSAYYIDAVLDVNLSHPIDSIIMEYGLNSFAFDQSTEMTFDGTNYAATLGPFDQKLGVLARAIALDSFGDTYIIRDSMWFELFIPPEESCSIAQVASTAPPVENFSNEEASFASLTGLSVLEISIGGSGNLTATKVIDNDASIERADIFYQTGTNVTQTTFFGVTQGQSLGNIPASADFSWYNYFDSDGSVSIVSTLNQFLEEGGDPCPTGCPGGQPDYFSSLDIIATLADNQRSFELKAVLEKGSDTPDSIVFNYTLDNGSQRVLDLTDQGTTYEGVLGNFDGEFILRGFFVATGADGTQNMWIVRRWYALILEGEVECQELCGDGIDNNGDGKVDENCVLLPELFFLSKDVPVFSLSNQPIEVDVTVKNSGVVNANGFFVEFALNGIVLGTQSVASLNQNEFQKVSFSIPYKDEYEGENLARITIDPTNEVVELIETNNVYEQTIIIGPNFFDVTLNHNETYFPADYRQIRVRDAEERNVLNATVTIEPSQGPEIVLETDAQGIVEFQLPVSGTYAISITKEDFIPFQGKFSISSIVLAGLQQAIPTGNTQSFTVENEEKRKLEDGVLEVQFPLGATSKFDLSEIPLISFSVAQQGKYGLRIIRNDLVIFESDFLATGVIESLLIGPGSLLDILFGPIVRSPVLFLFLIILAAAAAYFAYNK
ncbi:hypothetical protein IIC68_02905, partial [archaeon]|nr:hypothetical protein [archaeon]